MLLVQVRLYLSKLVGKIHTLPLLTDIQVKRAIGLKTKLDCDIAGAFAR
jgi:hypothetical protein